MGIYSDFMGIYSDLMGYSWDMNGIEWDINVIYLLVMNDIAKIIISWENPLFGLGDFQ